MKLSIEHNFPDVSKQLARLQEGVAKKAMASALNKTIAQARTSMSREIREEFNLNTQEVNSSLVVRRASAGRTAYTLEATLEPKSSRGRSLNLIRFVEKSVSFAQARKRIKAGEGGTYKLRGGGVVQKTLQLRFKIKKKGAPVLVKGAFIANDGRTVFIREGKGRLPIRAVQTIDVAQMFNTKRINAKVVAMIKSKFGEIFANEAKFFTAKFNAGK